MTLYRNSLPQMSGDPFLTDGGLETTLYFIHGIDLPEFAAFVALDREDGPDLLRDYYLSYADIAKRHGAGFILESPTWRASRAWGERIGIDAERTLDYNRRGIDLMLELRAEIAKDLPHVVISGCMGSRGDGYAPEEILTAGEAETYHREQIGVLAETAADMVTTYTIPYADEAIGITRAAAGCGMPTAIGFTVETDGKLPSGESLREAIERVDAACDPRPAYYMINCAHPSHFLGIFDGGAWTERIQAIRANASAKSHEELEASTELDAGDPGELAGLYGDLKTRLPRFNIVGGC
ncbi:MAG: homocysteine S-methyltransferase family protein, partial [Candidatus Krumholzibacteriota bacterium]